MTIQYSIPIAQHGANGFSTNRLLNQPSGRTFGVTFKFDTPIPAGVIPSKKRQQLPKAPKNPNPTKNPNLCLTSNSTLRSNCKPIKYALNIATARWEN